MAFTINAGDVACEKLAPGVERQRLLTEARVAGTKILLDRLILTAGSAAELQIAPTDLAWFQVLEGELQMESAAGSSSLGAAHIVFLPPGFAGSLHSAKGAVVLFAEVPRAGRFDPGFAADPPALRVVDWTREPVLDSKHDARRRIYVVTPKLFGTKAIKGEMIIYPQGTAGANHHHEGAEHFMYVLKGAGTAYANERPIPVRKGDLIYYDDGERHWLRCDDREEMAFVEFFVPGVYKTVWAPGAPVCTWLPTGTDIEGREPARRIEAHSAAVASPADV